MSRTSGSRKTGFSSVPVSFTSRFDLRLHAKSLIFNTANRARFLFVGEIG
jgi:hypothetical protein